MKRLIALILSAVLLCPMWAGAQTTPSILPPFNWAGTMELTQSGGANFEFLPIPGFNCQSITKINLSIEVPNNNSAAMGANGYFNCSVTGSSPSSISGSFLALNSNLQLASSTETVSAYQGTLYLGALLLSCYVTASTMNMKCTGYSLTGTQLPGSSMFYPSN
jgi:hypothetical protein